jgi:hypothetical protein
MIMKVRVFFLCLIALTLVSASTPAGRLVTLTVINKSGRAIELSLTGKGTGSFYYLRVPAGDREVPTEKDFTVLADQYSSTLHYVELWDPVYGYTCKSKSQSLNLTRQVRLFVLECEISPANAGEPPSIVKYGGRGGGHHFPR